MTIWCFKLQANIHMQVDLVLDDDHMVLGASEDLRGVDILSEYHQHHNEGDGDDDDHRNVVGDLQNKFSFSKVDTYVEYFTYVAYL